MNVYLISYDLSAPDTREHYQRLIDQIKSYDSWAKPLESLWLIRTSKSLTVVRDDLKQYVLANDKLFLIDVSQRFWAFSNIGDAVVQWVRANILP